MLQYKIKYIFNDTLVINSTVYQTFLSVLFKLSQANNKGL